MRFLLTRRVFSQLLGGLGLNALGLAAASPARAAGEGCAGENSDIVNSEAALPCEPDRCLFWSDAAVFDKLGLAQRATAAFFLKFPQNEQSYIDKVVLADDSRKALGVRYLTASDKTSGGYPPYLIFDKVDFSYSPRYFLIFQVRKGDKTEVYQRSIVAAELKRRSINSDQLGTVIGPALQRSVHKGIASSPFIWASSLTPEKATSHLVRARLMALSNNHDFTVRVHFLHDDVSKTHYMRYFLVTDPVGRLLGAVERGYNEGKEKFVDVKPLTETERNKWGLTQDKVAKINDCPYIMVFVDDVAEAYAKTSLWLR